jgi:hypothetical protein
MADSNLAQAFAVDPLPRLGIGGERTIVLPGGVLDQAGRCYKTVTLRELTGADEELLCQRFENGAEQVTAFLARAIAGIDGWQAPIDVECVRNMLVGDRDYVLLRLRQAEVGNQVHEVVRCRASGCGRKVDVDFLISELPVRHVATVAHRYAVALIDDHGGRHDARLRLPTGADLEAVAGLIASQPGAANTRLYARILESIHGYEVGSEERMRALPLRLRSQLAAFVARTSPGPDLLIDVACPHCQADLAYTFDLHAFFLPSVP